MNYFSKNLKTLRAELQLSQVEFGLLFDLSKSNINSYENGAFPKMEMFIGMMDHFNLDPSKFVTLDMTRHAVYRDHDAESTDMSILHDHFVQSAVSEADQFRYLKDFSKKQLRAIFIKVFRTKESLLKENLDLKEKYIALLESHRTMS